jgi:hypothetical protein
MQTSSIDQLLSQVERAVDEVGQALVGGDTQPLLQASQQLRQATFFFSQKLAELAPQDLLDAAVRNRIRRVQGLLAAQRGGLARQNARVENALHALVPGSRDQTYGHVSNGRYGAGLKQTGAFKVLAA